jgi:hypothetical protein
LTISKDIPDGLENWLSLGVSKEGTVRLWAHDEKGLSKAQPRNGNLCWKTVIKLESSKPMIWYITVRAKTNEDNLEIDNDLLDYLDSMSISTACDL